MALNQQLSAIFSDFAAIYRYLGDRFRALAYQKAARLMAGLTEDVRSYIDNDTLEELPGIGEHLAEKIREYAASGKIKQYEELKKQVPHGIMDLMEIRGFGPESLRKIHSTLKTGTKAELIRALQDGRVEQLPGFGPKKVGNMLRGLKLHKTVEERMLLWDALAAGEQVLAFLKQLPGVKQAEMAGSLRRRKETIGDIDLLVACARKDRKRITGAFTSGKFAAQVLARGDTKSSILLAGSGRQADLRIVNEDEWGAALQYFTGSKEHNIRLRTLAKEKGYRVSEYGVFTIAGDKKIAGATEEEIYRSLGMEIIPPEMREDRGEIELALRHKIPSLVSATDIRGDLHVHSNWSDGSCSIAELAHEARSRFGYEYIAITDHSRSERIAHGLDEKRFLRQLKEIREVNKKLGHDFIKAGVEVDILRDGTPDASDELLAQLDWVTAAIHNNFSGDNTERLLRACENPYVHCIAHPTGRMIGQREAYKINFRALIRAAQSSGTALELNAQPLRMDLDDELAREARESGVKLVIGTDAHQPAQFGFMKLGVSIARRAWCTAGDILNTHSWKTVQQFTEKKLKMKRKSYEHH